MSILTPSARPVAPTNSLLHQRQWRSADQPAGGAGATRQPVGQPAHLTELGMLLALDFLAANLGFYLAWYARYKLGLVLDLEPGNYVEIDVYLPFQLGLCLVFQLIVALRGLYRVPRVNSALDDATSLFATTGIALMALFATSTFVRYPAESRLTLIFAWVLIPVLAVVGRVVYLWLLSVFHSRGIGVSRTLVVGNNSLGRIIMQSLDLRPHLGLSVVGFLDGQTDGAFGRFKRLGDPQDLERIVKEEAIAQVIIALPGASHETIMQLVDHCRRGGVQFRLVPDLYEVSLGSLDVDTVSGIPLIGMKDASIRGVNFAIKRMLDVILSATTLVLFSWVFLALAIAIKLEDPRGPVLFGQTRVGRFGRPFTCWKFRSMHRDADSRLTDLLAQNEAEGPIFKMRDDPRRTRVGRFIRRFSLDELPQIWNIFVGDMSLVGPRPPTPREVALYEDWHLDRLETLPGLTGLWQVSGRSQLGFAEQVMLDITYIENWSLGLDFRILLRTIPAVVSGKGAF